MQEVPCFELDFQVQWKNFSETPFNRENFREVMAPGISGAWFGTEVKREGETVVEGKHILHVEHDKRNHITGTLQINRETFQIHGKQGRVCCRGEYAAAKGWQFRTSLSSISTIAALNSFSISCQGTG